MEGGREGGTWEQGYQMAGTGWQAPAMCGVYHYQQTCSCMRMIFMASIFGDVRRLTESETLAAARS